MFKSLANIAVKAGASIVAAFNVGVTLWVYHPLTIPELEALKLQAINDSQHASSSWRKRVLCSEAFLWLDIENGVQERVTKMRREIH